MAYGVLHATPRLAGTTPNRFLAALFPEDLALLLPHLRVMPLERGAVLHDPGESVDHVYFPHSGMVSLVTLMRNGATVETMTVGRAGVVGATVGLGSHRVAGRAVVQLPGAAMRLSAPHFHAAVSQS